MRLQLSIWAEDLPNVSALSTPDPFAVVTVLHKEQGVKPTVLGKTEVLQNTNSPDWTKILLLDDYLLGKPTHLVVSIYDSSNHGNHAMGSTIFEVGAILGAKGQIAAKELKRGGICVAHVEQATQSGVLDFRLRAVKLTNTEGMGLVNRSDPFFELQRMRRSVKNGARVWDCVFRSKNVDNNLSPIWSEASVELGILCGGNQQQTCRLVVYDWNKNGKHEVMGDVKFTVQELLQSVTESGLAPIAQVNTDKALTLKKTGRESGKIVVVSAQVTGVVDPVEESVEVEFKGAQVPDDEADIVVAADDEDIEVEPDELVRLEPSFVNYIRGGCKLHVVTAIDATASNGDPRQPTSLHHFKAGGHNDYEQALNSICTILSKYDSDQKYPLYGFGAKQNGGLSHCFQIGPKAEVDGVEGILEAYSTAFKAGITMSSPRDFAIILETAAKDARAQLEASQAYSSLLIFTNGSPADSGRMVSALKAADDAPLSVVIIGVGEGNFKDLEAVLEQHKTSDCRDNVRFVNYQALKGDEEKMTEAALDAIPDQLVAYFARKGIDPLPEAEAEDVVVQPYNEQHDVVVPIEFTKTGEPVVSGDVKPPMEKKEEYSRKFKAGFKKFGQKLQKQKLGQIKRRVNKLSRSVFGVSAV